MPIGERSDTAAILFVAALVVLSFRPLNRRYWPFFAGFGSATILYLRFAYQVPYAHRRWIDIGFAVIPFSEAFDAALTGVAFGLALGALRAPSPTIRWLAVVVSALGCASIVGTVAYHVSCWTANTFADVLSPTSLAGLSMLGAAIWVPAATWLMQRAAQRDLARRVPCHKCGYDIRGSIEAARCPECGTPIPNPRDVASAVKDTEDGCAGSSTGV